MRGPKFYKVIIVALVVLNLATLSFYWFSKPPHPPRPGAEKLSLKLELKGDSKSKVDALEIQHHKDKKKLMRKDHTLHEILFNRIGTGKPADALLSKIDENKVEIELMTFDFFDEVAKYCNRSQKKQLIEFVQTRLNRIRPGGPPPPRK